MDNSKIEDICIGELQYVVNQNLLLSHNFNRKDKEMSWDGTIEIYNSEKFIKNTFEDKVEVQIKGHLDKKNKYLDKEKIKYQVSVADLQVYFKSRGVLYFHIFLSKSMKKKEIFYAILYPAKIKEILRQVSERKNLKGKEQKTVGISFYKMKKDVDEIYRVTKQFSIESKLQGVGTEQIVQNMIEDSELDELESIKFTVIGAKSDMDVLKSIGKGDVCFRGKRKGERIEFPISPKENIKHFFMSDVKKDIKIGDKVFYREYQDIKSSDGEYIRKLSENLKIDIKNNIIKFTPKTTFSKMRNDLEYLLAKWDNVDNEKYKKELKDILFLKDICIALEMLNINYDVPYDNVSEKDIISLGQIVNIMNNDSEKIFIKQDMCFYIFELNKKYIPLFITKDRKVDGKIELINAVVENKNILAEFTVKEDENESIQHHRIPPFVKVRKKYIANLFSYEFDSMKKQIEETEVNDVVRDVLNECVLSFIGAYDINNDYKILILAKKLAERLYKEFPEEIIYLINLMQIKKRDMTFNNSDRKSLTKFLQEQKDIQILCAINILLDDIDKAKLYLEKMEINDKKIFIEYPICFLLEGTI